MIEKEIVVQPLFRPVNLPIFTMPEDFQETSKKALRRMMRQLNLDDVNAAKDNLSVVVHDYIDILHDEKPDPEIKAYYEKVWKCSEYDSMQTKMTTDRSSGQSNIPIGVAGTETATQSLSLTLIKKRTSSDNGLKPQILILKNGQKLLSQIDSLVQTGTKDK